MALLDTTGKRLRALRERRGWTQIELGERLKAMGVAWATSHISRIEAGHASPSVEMLRALALILDTSTDFLMCLSDREGVPSLTHVNGDGTSLGA